MEDAGTAPAGGLDSARADFVAGLGRRLDSLRSAVNALESDPRSAPRRDNVRRRLHALASAVGAFGVVPSAEPASGEAPDRVVQQFCATFNRCVHVRALPGGILRVSEAKLEIDNKHRNARPETDGLAAVTGAVVVLTHSYCPCSSRGTPSSCKRSAI